MKPYREKANLRVAVKTHESEEQPRGDSNQVDCDETASAVVPRTLSTSGIDMEGEGGRDAAEDSLPAALGPYRVVGRLGRGAMGLVYEAIDPRDGTTLAIKMVQGMSPEAVFRFKREFRSLASFEHPNVVSLYDLHMEEGRFFFTMELVRGRDLVSWLCGTRLAQNHHAPCSDHAKIEAVFTQLAAGLHAIHRAGLLHRDLKPSNVLVTDEGRVVILDFGLVRDDRIEEGRSINDDGILMGTPLYMSPEQAGNEPLGPASDWYAVGEMLYQALTGRPPFVGLGMLALLAAKRESMPPPPTEHVPDLPARLVELTMALLARQPEDRPDGDTVLERLGAGERSGTPPPSDGIFLGREREIQVLARGLATTAAGRPVVVLVEGPSGIGKTTLVQEFLARRSPGREVLVLRGKCSEREAIPYKALDSVMDALSMALRRLPTPGEVRAFLPRDMGALCRLFPVLLRVPAIGMAPSRAESSTDPAELRRRSFAALSELWGRIADERRLVVWIDDLQWSDLDSVVLLDAVLRRPDAPAILLVCTFRSPSAVGNEPLVRFLEELEHREDAALGVERIRLQPMDRRDATSLALGLLGARDRRTRALAEEVAYESEGSPFFVEELVRYVRRTEGASPLEATTSDSAVSLDNVIRHRLRELPADARALVDVLAVAGGRLASRVAIGVALGEGRGNETLRRLQNEHLVRLGTGDDDVVEIHHDRIRETALRDIVAERLPEIHLALGRALAAYGNADEVALSHHFRQAGEERLATAHTLAAADQAAEALAFDRAAQLYQAVLGLGALAPVDASAVHAKLGDALANAGRLYDSAQAYLRAAEHAPPDDAVEWLRRAAEHLLSSGHGEEGRDALRRVLERVGLRLPKSDAWALASLLRQRALLAVRGLRHREADPKDIPTRTLQQLDVCWTAARGLIYTDGLAGADFHARHLRLALDSGDPVRISRALGCEAHLMLALSADGKLERGRALLEQAAALAERTDSHYAKAMVVECSGHASIAVGHWQQAADELHEAIALFRDHCTGVSHEIGYCRAHAAICLLMMGRVGALTPVAHELLRDARERAHPYAEGFARGLLGNIVLLAPDRVEEAEEQLLIYRRDAPRRFQAHLLNYVCQTAALERYRGRPDAAWEAAERDWPTVAKMALLRSPHARGEMQLWRGGCAVAAATTAAEPEPLLHVAHQMADALSKHPCLHARGYGHLVKAGAVALQGDVDRAVQLLREAIDAFEARHMSGFTAAAQHRLGNILGGDEGRTLLERAAEYMHSEGIVRPERFVEMTAPGFGRLRSSTRP